MPALNVILILLLATAVPLRAEPLDFALFHLGQEGKARNVPADQGLVDSLMARDLTTVTPLPANRLAWSEALQMPGERLVVAVTRFGTRLEVLALLLDDGAVRHAARRPASTSADMRRDRGLPGSNQLLPNAFAELAADLAQVLERLPQGLSGETLSVAVEPLVDAAGPEARGGLELTYRQALEAQTLAVLALEGMPIRLAAADDDPDFRLAARTQAIRLDLRFAGPDRHFLRRHVRQEDLVPMLVAGWRKHLRWHDRVSDIKVLNPSWESMDLLAGKAIVARLGEEAFIQIDPTTGETKTMTTPPPGTGIFRDHARLWLAAEERREPVWELTFPFPIGALVEADAFLFVFTDDGMMHRLASASGERLAAHDLGRRMRGAGGIVDQSQLWICDLDAALLVIDWQEGRILHELQLADSLAAPPVRFGENILLPTAARELVVVNPAGEVRTTAVLPARLAQLLPLPPRMAILDQAGNLFFWLPDESQPRLHVATGYRPAPGMTAVSDFPTTWPAETNQDDPMALDLVESKPVLLLPTASGLLLILPLDQ